MLFKRLWFLFLAAALLTAGCSKKSDNPAGPDESISGSGSIVLNGGSFSNKTVNLINGVSAYTNSNSATICVLYGSAENDSLTVMVAFQGKSAGSFDWQGYLDNGSDSYYDGCSVSYYGSASGLYLATGGKTTVNVFGDVGKTIEGTFSGTLESMDGSQTVTVSGSFKCLRVPDE